MASSPYVSDSDFYQDGYRDITEEEEEEYYRALGESQGFDVPAFSKVFAFGIIIPLPEELLSHKIPELRVYTEEAIKHYNQENGTNFEVVKIVKANHQAARGLLYYITFEGKQVETPPEFPTTIFQARVLAGIPDTIEVELCRPKPSN